MAVFCDNRGDKWPVVIDVNAVKRAKNLVDVNPLEIFGTDLANRLATDPVLLVNTIYAVCQPDAERRHISEIEFGERLTGDAIDDAQEALMQATIDFFPKARREVAGKIWAATKAAMDEGIDLANEKLTPENIAAAIEGATNQARTELDAAFAKMKSTPGKSRAS